MDLTEMSQNEPITQGELLPEGQLGLVAEQSPTTGEPLPDKAADPVETFEPGQVSPDGVVELSRRRRSRVVDVGVALPETFARVVVGEVDAPNRRLVIPVSLDQAAMLAMALKALPRRRPFLADVMVDVLNQFSMGIAMVSITGRQGEIYLAELTVVDSQGRQRNVPSRPSDALLIALTSPVHPPIMVDEALFG